MDKVRAVLLCPDGVAAEDVEHGLAVAQEPAAPNEPDVAHGRRCRVQARDLRADVRDRVGRVGRDL